MTYHTPHTSAELMQCAELAALAFADYEYFTRFFPDREARLRFLRAVLRSEYRTTRRRSHHLVARRDGQPVAAVNLFPPDWRKPHDLAYMLHGWGRVMRLPDQASIRRWLAMDEEAGHFCHSLLGGTTWYINALVVSPDCQGSGVGRRFMLEGILPYISQHGGTRLCLFTNSEANLRFYRSLGFSLLRHHDIPCPTGTAMGSWDLGLQLYSV